MNIYSFSREVSKRLKINQPQIIIEKLPGTQIARCSSDGGKLWLRSKDVTFDVLFAICHELRHIWQAKNDREKFLTEYHTLEQCKSVDEYNLQPAELDANAWAAKYMIDNFGVKPLFNGLSDNVISEIYKSAEKL